MIIEDLVSIKWSKDNYFEFKNLLYSYKDPKYKEFNEKIIPNIGNSIGVRMPTLRNISKNLSKNNDLVNFYNFLEEGDTYEEKIIQGMILPYLPYEIENNIFNNIDMYILRINNWALCDSFVVSLKNSVNKNKEGFFLRSKKYIRSNNPWEIRFGLVLLNNYFTDRKYIEEIFLMTRYIKNNQYYVTMAIAWLISTCYFVDKVLTLNFIKEGKLTEEITKKTIQKILESKKLSDSDKNEIKEVKNELTKNGLNK